MCSWQLVDAGVDADRVRNAEERQIAVHGREVDRPRCVEGAVGEQRLELRAEEQSLVRERVVEWLDADAIARKEQRLAARVPDCEREHTAQMLHALFAVLLVEPHDNFRVARSPKAVPARDELLSQRLEVVYLAVEAD